VPQVSVLVCDVEHCQRPFENLSTLHPQDTLNQDYFLISSINLQVRKRNAVSEFFTGIIAPSIV